MGFFERFCNGVSDFFQGLADRIKPSPRIVTRADQRDKKKSGTRHGANGTGLSRRQRAQHLDDDTLKKKLISAQTKAGRAVGGLGRQAVKAKATFATGHWHLTPGAAVSAGSNLIDTGKQSMRFDDYETEYLARGLEHDDQHTSRFWSSVGDGALGIKKAPTEKIMKPVKKALKAEQKAEHAYDRYQEAVGNYYHPDGKAHYTYSDGQGNWWPDTRDIVYTLYDSD